jgi:hypothetical protein
MLIQIRISLSTENYITLNIQIKIRYVILRIQLCQNICRKGSLNRNFKT